MAMSAITQGEYVKRNTLSSWQRKNSPGRTPKKKSQRRRTRKDQCPGNQMNKEKAEPRRIRKERAVVSNAGQRSKSVHLIWQ